MMLETESDRQAMLSALGEALLIEGRPVFGIYRADPSTLELGFEVDTHTSEIELSAADAEDIVRGTIINRGIKKHKVERIVPDGTGMTTLWVSDQ